MSLSEHLCTRCTEIAFAHGKCTLCKRQGMPILLVRTALVPKAHSSYHLPEPEIADMHLGLRTLRAGYVYLLLDDKVWQAYQVSPDGYLRQFNPYRPPRKQREPVALGLRQWRSRHPGFLNQYRYQQIQHSLHGIR